MYWIVVGIVMAALVALYVAVFLYGRRRQKTFDAQYSAAKERHEVFVLNKKITKERPKSRFGRFLKVKTYQVVGRITVSQAMRGMQVSRMQTVTFQTTKSEYEKIEPNRKYKMDIAGNYIGYVLAPSPAKTAKPDKAKGKTGKSEKKPQQKDATVTSKRKRDKA